MRKGFSRGRRAVIGRPSARWRAIGRHATRWRAIGRHALRGPAAGLRSDRGSATVWSVGAITVLCIVFGVVLALGHAVVSRHRAAGGADLAALAAADHWAKGGTAACGSAERVARAQGVRLVRCVLVGDMSDVTAASGRGPFAAEVRARAGPAGAPGANPPTGSPPFGPTGADDRPTDDPRSGNPPFGPAVTNRSTQGP
ncbi:Rv3654c family TadE-like protein [Streptomyces sp. NPDC057623]|uniref:Rv3654c family TadE-like protein n=1 Tax=Streptomyces sp. NPDC057623 TaxID=3346187 RepID=UPI00367725B2